MLLAAFLKEFELLPPERYRTLGASSMGSCARRLAMAQFPERYVPTPMTPRRRARMMAGKAFETFVMQKIQRALPAAAAGETAFLWPVKVDVDTLLAAMDKVNDGRITGHILPNMNPNAIPRWRQACVDKGIDRLSGIVIDPVPMIVYIPALADGIADLSRMPEFSWSTYALATHEFKTIATAGFRRVIGHGADYTYRTQFAIQVDAANLDTHVAMFYRLETSHGIEIIYSRRNARVTARFALSNGSAHYVDGGEIVEPNAEWDEVRITHPFEPALLEQARARLIRVLNATVDALPEREYGPDFTCGKCRGSGVVKCGWCDLDGIAKRSKTTKKGEAKPGVPCKRSNGQAHVACDGCGGHGIMDATELKFPCSWCPFLADCYPFAKTILEPKPFTRPKVIVARSDYEASKSTFTHPERA